MSIADNIVEIRGRIARAAQRAGRDSGSVTLMAVSKTVDAARIREAYDAGLRVFGENRVQEFAEKATPLRDLAGAQWHLIGHLQTNKAKKAAELFQAIDSVDSLRLAQKLDQAAQQMNRVLPVMIEINIGGELSKSGLQAEVDRTELEELLHGLMQFQHLQVRGLMTVPPYMEDPEGARPYFRRVRGLCDSIAARRLPRIEMDELSMGMSHDFEIAVEEGSTCVRVGTAIFGTRSSPA